MSYYQSLDLKEEPFSNSPDPGFFYRIPGRVECLNLLEISLRLKRGMSVVLGDVGAGKTTLCRQLLQNLRDDNDIVVHLMLDPYFKSTHAFLTVLYTMLCGEDAPSDATEWKLKEDVKDALLKIAGDGDKTIVLIIDEGQKVTDECLELLRELLNFETNKNKLLQIIIFAQLEFNATIERFPNFKDRIHMLETLTPLNVNETKEMIEYRLDQAKFGDKAPDLFSKSGYRAIQKATSGYPRKITTLCHKCLLQLIVLQKKKVDAAIVKSILNPNAKKFPFKWAACFICAISLSSALYFLPWSEDEAQISSFDQATEVNNQVSLLEPSAVVVKSDVIERVNNDNSVAQSPEKDFFKDHISLGELYINDAQMFRSVIKDVYGVHNNSIFASVCDVNNIKSMSDEKFSGTIVSFPKIFSTTASQLNSSYIVKIGSYTTLQSATEDLSSIRASGVDVTLLPLFSQEFGLTFSISFAKTFLNESSAVAAIKELPDRFRDSTSVVTHWPDSVLLYKSPKSFAPHESKTKVVTATSYYP